MAQVIGDYELIERIGAGGMGEVWRAQNIHTHVGCAVKLLPSEATADRTFVARFFDEGRLMQTLDHPRIVRVHHVGHDTPSGRHFLVMDFVAGPSGKACSLHDLLEQSPDRRLPEADVRRWATQVAEALSYAHEQGVVHRDIKPANVLVDRDNNARVADFGLAKAVGEEWLQSQIHASVARSMGNTKTIMPKNRVERSMGDEKTGGSDRPSGPRSSGDALLGTYDYMAPEQRGDLDAPISPATDIYAFGVMLYRLLTGRRPTGMTKPVSQVVPGLSKEWDTLISRCLEHDPKERYANGAALLEALDGLGRGTRGSSKVREFGSSKVKDSKTWLWLVGAAVIAVVSILSIWSMQSSRAKRDVMHLEPPANTSEPKEDQAFRNATVGNVLGMAFVDVSPGSFEMGSNSGKVFEKPVRTVRITKPFWMGKCEVTQREYRQLMGANPSRFVGDDLPVEKVTWDDAVKFCEDLTRLERAAGRLPAGYVYRLPTEAEWEYAAGGGQRSQGFTYSGGNEINAVAWHGENSDMKTQPVGGKQANALGLHDMSGNVYEWCHDWWQDGYGGLSTTDPTGPLNGSSRICRGGTYFWHASHCRIASRNCCVSSGTYESIGIRVVLGPVLNEKKIVPEEVKMLAPVDGQDWTSPETGMKFVWVPALKLWVGKYEVTNGEYRKKDPAHDSKAYEGNSLNGERQPVVQVNFDDAKTYAAWLTERDMNKLGGLRYRLPSEAEWLSFAQCGDN
ncbi:MAG: bifunctional serine/threonine-protein kinase/formylglycine-generating enzyme family protein, partial [bacterium]